LESFRLEGIDVVRHVLIGMASASALAAEKTSARAKNVQGRASSLGAAVCFSRLGGKIDQAEVFVGMQLGHCCGGVGRVFFALFWRMCSGLPTSSTGLMVSPLLACGGVAGTAGCRWTMQRSGVSAALAFDPDVGLIPGIANFSICISFGI